MSETWPADDDRGSLAEFEHVVERCDRYEAAWREGRRPRIEDYLAEAPEPERVALLLRELLALELELRSSGGERPEPQEYRQRFPGHVELINRILNEAGPSAPHDQQAPTEFQKTRRKSSPQEESFAQTSAPEIGKADWPEVAGYDILAELGHGGMGVVYQARQQQLKRLVALKMIRAGLRASPEDLDRFRIEAEAIARLHHANIVQIYDIGEVAGLPFVALELLEGGSLADRLAGTPQPGRQAAELMVTLARAIHAAHQAGIVHRDLKPTNVLFDRDSTPKIVDFGLAKRLEMRTATPRPGRSWARPATWRPNRRAGKRGRSARRPTCTPWERSSMRC